MRWDCRLPSESRESCRNDLESFKELAAEEYIVQAVEEVAEPRERYQSPANCTVSKAFGAARLAVEFSLQASFPMGLVR